MSPGSKVLHIGFGTAKATLVDRRGTETLEFAIVSLLFLALILGVVELGRVMWIANGLHLAVQQAARCGAIGSSYPSSCTTPAQVQTFAASVAGTPVGSSAFTATPQVCAGSPSVCTPSCGYQVSATYAVQLYIPYVHANPTLTAEACFPM
jgi:Flp pilus assembly protein TadG